MGSSKLVATEEVSLVYLMDPHCGWCFGFGGTIRAFYERVLEHSSIAFKVVTGGLFIPRIAGSVEFAAWAFQRRVCQWAKSSHVVTDQGSDLTGDSGRRDAFKTHPAAPSEGRRHNRHVGVASRNGGRIFASARLGQPAKEPAF
jgi:hypothetical protein